MVGECGLVEERAEGLSSARWDELFVAINTAEASKADAAYNHKKAINRQEFLCLLVRAATLRHIAMPGGRHTDVAAALSQLLSSEILPKASRGDRQLLLSNNYFREMNCYTAETSDVLRKYHLSVRLIFERYAIGEGRAGDRLDSIDLMSIEEWRTLVSHLDLVDMQFREREATQCFMRSRMRVVQESETRGRAKLLQLCYEDFLVRQQLRAVQQPPTPHPHAFPTPESGAVERI